LSGERVERRLAAILAADVAGFMPDWGDEEGTLNRLKTQRGELVDPKNSCGSPNGQTALACILSEFQPPPLVTGSVEPSAMKSRPWRLARGFDRGRRTDQSREGDRSLYSVEPHRRDHPSGRFPCQSTFLMIAQILHGDAILGNPGRSKHQPDRGSFRRAIAKL
jgi:hypothetical protein